MANSFLLHTKAVPLQDDERKRLSVLNEGKLKIVPYLVLQKGSRIFILIRKL